MKKRFRSLLALGVIAPAALVAQQQPASADTGAKSVLSPDFSGQVFGSYQYRGDNTVVGGVDQHGKNQFTLDRAYLTFKMPAGDRASVRVTADIFNPGTGAGSGLDYRIKYGYMNYRFVQGTNWTVDGRAGMIQGPVIDQIENFWPRYLGNTAVERNGYQNSADLGAAALIGMPNKMGELYLGVLNGPGYTTPTDDNRFKDYAARLTLTPFRSSTMWLMQNLTLLGYYYKGTVDGNVGGEGQGMGRDKFGGFVGVKDPRLTAGFEYDQLKQNYQSGTPTSITTTDSSGRVMSVFGTLRPFQMMDKSGLPIGIVLRYDYDKPKTDVDATNKFFLGGLTYDLNNRVQVSLDYQENTLSGTPTSPLPLAGYATSKFYSLHWNVNF